MTRIETNTGTETPVWSAHNLPKPTPPRALRFAVVAVTAGLVAVILGAALGGPIQTPGTRMEPTRFTAKAQQADKTDATGIVVAAGLN